MLDSHLALSASALNDPSISAQAYNFLSGLIHQHSHIQLGPNKQSLLTSRLSKHRRDLRIATWEDYVRWLSQNQTDGINTVIDLIATNHTQFFREKIHFDLLRDGLIQQLLINCESAQAGLRCWSAACSTGEEPYTLAIVLSQFAEQKHPGMRWKIDATDISYRALNKAMEGVYDVGRLSLPDPVFLRKYFQKGSGPYEGFCKVKDLLREKIHFSQLNLFGERLSLLERQHIIFCRNVLIYFDLTSQNQLIERLHGVLEPGGLLIVGHSDSLLRINHRFKGLGNGVYMRIQ